MELKLDINSQFIDSDFSFNRTFMELKCVFGVILSRLLISFNRTFMELKYFSGS